jgi:hypothetical protein
LSWFSPQEGLIRCSALQGLFTVLKAMVESWNWIAGFPNCPPVHLEKLAVTGITSKARSADRRSNM